VDAERRRAVVEPGVTLDQLNEALSPHGLMFGPDVATSSHATIGGMVGNNSAGAHSILYGRTVENLVSLDVLLADGSVERFEEGSCDHSSGRLHRKSGVATPRSSAMSTGTRSTSSSSSWSARPRAPSTG
jgi:FAD/FMN-containing dehydrogenase